MSQMPENKLADKENRFGVYELDTVGTADPAPEVTVFKDGSVQIVSYQPEDELLILTPRQARQLAIILNATPAGGPVTRGEA